MTSIDELGKPRPKAGGAGLRASGGKLLGDLAGRYRALRKRLADMLTRGDRDYTMLSALSQEIGAMRQKIRAELKRRRVRRASAAAARRKPPALSAAPGTSREA